MVRLDHCRRLRTLFTSHKLRDDLSWIHHIEEEVLVLVWPGIDGRILQPERDVVFRRARHQDRDEALVETFVHHVLRLHAAVDIERVEGRLVLLCFKTIVRICYVRVVLWGDENEHIVRL